ncbi:MAG: hypothetical protein ACK4GO_13125 [Gemmobacter sp.]
MAQDGAAEDDVPMTLLVLGKEHWLYEGEELLNDVLTGTGRYPFSVRCVYFADIFELKEAFPTDFELKSLWRINPEVIARLRTEDLLIEVKFSDF